MRVLLTDDDIAASSALKKMLEARSFEVAMADTFKRGLDEALAFKPDVILLDADLPDSTGFETMARIPEFGGIPIVVYSAFDEEELAIAAFKNGASDFIWKTSESNVAQRITWAHFRNLYARK